ncbi:lipopolysaccharide biosynthesis protein [Rhodococcus pyridinivorans]|uniref:lipopolysaccharide biosynthesis protein n=1 Tax=Rhodococcus pyridinivorans TaxID=103816 RepID=UPI001E28DF5D|nr:lipopolysaccharide biosynthesis protein [Rhodococcus pyridinivorans]UGQ59056.1 lipopolysaccharide biosynthesis protein [Rhodococcus pyridinivorans]
MLLGTVALARLLSPEDFGLVAVVLSLVAFGELVRDFGLSTAAARATDLSRGQQSNLFWINSAIGVVLAILAWASAGLVADVFSQPQLKGIVEWISLVFVVNGISTQFRAEINRKLDFKRLAVVDSLPVMGGLAVALIFILALNQQNYWALVVQQLSTAVLGLALAVILAKWIPGLPSARESVRELISFSAGLFGTQGVAYFTRNIDNLSISFFWGPASLGIYSRAYQLLMVPINQMSAPLTRVTVPILTRVAGEKAKFLSYLSTGQLVGGIGIGFVYGVLFGLADPIVLLVFGESWSAITPVFQALAIGGVFRALNQVTFWVFLAKGATASQFKFYLVSQPLVIACMLSGLPWGAVGVAVGHSVGYALNWTISFWWCGRVTSTPMKSLYFSGVKSILAFTAPLALIGVTTTYLVINPWISIGVGLAVSVLYIAVAWCVSSYVRSVVTSFARAAGHLRKTKAI